MTIAPFSVKGAIPRINTPLMDDRGQITDEWRKGFFEPIHQMLMYQGGDAVQTLETTKVGDGDDVSRLNNDATYTPEGANVSVFTNDAAYTPEGANISVFTNDAGYFSSADSEAIQDIVGGMVTGNTETLITVTYQDSDGTLDFVVDEAGLTIAQSQVTGLSTALAGKVGTTSLGALSLTVSDPPTQAEVQAIADKVDAIVSALT
jgi:hypothetical protein